MVDLVSIPITAEVLGVSVSRARAMAVAGLLPAVKIGNRWLVERGELEALSRRPRPGGRPFAPHNAWVLLCLASDLDVEGVDPSVRSRLRRALRLQGLERLAPGLSSRAESRALSAHPGEVTHVVKDPRLLRTGISAAGAHDLGLVSGSEADGYVHAETAEAFAADHALLPGGVDGNVRLRLVPDGAWRYLEGLEVAPLAAVALDLAEDPDPRSALAGRKALREIDRSWAANASKRLRAKGTDDV